MLGLLPLTTTCYPEPIPCALCVNEIRSNKIFYVLWLGVKDRKPEGVHPECARAALEKVVEIRRQRKAGGKPA